MHLDSSRATGPFLALLMPSLSTNCPYFVVPPALQLSVQPSSRWAAVSVQQTCLQLRGRLERGAARQPSAICVTPP